MASRPVLGKNGCILKERRFLQKAAGLYCNLKSWTQKAWKGETAVFVLLYHMENSTICNKKTNNKKINDWSGRAYRLKVQRLSVSSLWQASLEKCKPLQPKITTNHNESATGKLIIRNKCYPASEAKRESKEIIKCPQKLQRREASSHGG